MLMFPVIYYELSLTLVLNTGIFSSTITAVDHQLIKQNNNNKIFKKLNIIEILF